MTIRVSTPRTSPSWQRSTSWLWLGLALAAAVGCTQYTGSAGETTGAGPAAVPNAAAASAAKPGSIAAKPGSIAAKPAPTAAKPAPTPVDASEEEFPVEPPDGKWLVDDQDRQYFLHETPRVEGWYYWLNPEKTRVRLAYGLEFDVASYDEHSFQIKIYKSASASALQRASQAPPPLTEPEKEAIAARYRNPTGSVDALTFTPFGRGLPDHGQWRNGFKIADLNGDGHPDIIHGPPRKGSRQPVVFLGDGQGNWRRWAEVRFPPLQYDYGDVAVADFNGDGRLDLAFAIHLKGYMVVVADGPASFVDWGRGLDFQVPGQDNADASGYSSRTLEAADWNGDGRIDLISVGEGPHMVAGTRERPSEAYGMIVYLNQGDGSWVRKDELKDGVRGFGEDLVVADLNHDGKLDAVLGSSVMGASDILRFGGADGSWSREKLADVRPRGYVSAVNVGDFNGDGRLDLALGFLSREAEIWRTGIDLFVARAAGGWERHPVVSEENRDWLTAIDSGDLDGDGKLDLAAVTGDGELWTFLGKGDGSFLRAKEPPEVAAPASGCRGFDVRIADLDGVPGAELVAEFAGEASANYIVLPCKSEGRLVAWKVLPRK